MSLSSLGTTQRLWWAAVVSLLAAGPPHPAHGNHAAAVHGATAGTSRGARRVNWYTSPVGVEFNRPGAASDHLNNSEWARVHRSALTGYYQDAACFLTDSSNNGTFYSSARCSGLAANRSVNGLVRPEWAALYRAEARQFAELGLEFAPSGVLSIPWLLGRGWEQPGVLESAVQLCRREGWSGLFIDNEQSPGEPGWDPKLPQCFAEAIGNLSKALEPANLTLVIAVTSTWHYNLSGPENLALYARHVKQRRNVRFFDMAEYTARGHVPSGNLAQLQALKHNYGIPIEQLAPAVGLVDSPGHANASCEGWPVGRPRCANFTDPACGCFDYGWNQSSFHQFVRDVEALGFQQLDVYRADTAPPPGTQAAIPSWFIAELEGFLGRGRERRRHRRAKSDDGGSQMVADLRAAADFLDRGVLTAAEFADLKSSIFAGGASAAAPVVPAFTPTTAFRTAGLGVTARSLTVRAADSFNVKDYGARGDGSGLTPADTHDDVTAEPWNNWTLYAFHTDRGHSRYWANSQGTFQPPRPQPFLNTDTWDSIGINLAIWTAANKRVDWCAGLGPPQYNRAPTDGNCSMGEVVIPAGNYAINVDGGSIKLMKGMEVSIRGAGMYHTTLQTKENSTFFADPARTNGQQTFEIIDAYRPGGPPTYIEDLALMGCQNYSPSNHNLVGVKCTNTNGLFFKGIWFTAMDAGISMQTESGELFVDECVTE